MSEINRVYKKYGEIAGKEYLVIFYSSTLTAARFEKNSDNKGLAAFKTRLEELIKKEFGQDFFTSYTAFEKENESNRKLLKELNDNKSDFLSKRITDLEKEPQGWPKREESKPEQEKKTVPERKPIPDPVRQNQIPVNKSSLGSVSVNGTKVDFSYDNPDKAIPVVKSAIFLQPHDADNWCILGDLYGAKKDWKSAIECFEKALVKNPKSTRATTGMERAKGILNGSIPDGGKQSFSAGQTFSASREPVDEDVTYCFENQQEFLLYVSLNKDRVKGKLLWGKGTQYQDACKRGFVLFEQKQFAQSIDAYKLALKYNPVGVAARFEICTAYCQLHDLSSARKALKEVEPYLYSDQLIAKYYRTLGFILIEELDYKTAANAYQYSLFFEPNHQQAKQELLFIVNKIGFDVLDEIKDRKKVERALETAGIPLLKPIL